MSAMQPLCRRSVWKKANMQPLCRRSVLKKAESLTHKETPHTPPTPLAVAALAPTAPTAAAAASNHETNCSASACRHVRLIAHPTTATCSAAASSLSFGSVLQPPFPPSCSPAGGRPPPAQSRVAAEQRRLALLPAPSPTDLHHGIFPAGCPDGTATASTTKLARFVDMACAWLQGGTAGW
jgi:hypothetical protein